MKPGETCSTCGAFSSLTSECRRKAPTAVLIPMGPGQAGVKGIYPPTTKDGWCCDWTAAESRVEMLARN